MSRGKGTAALSVYTFKEYPSGKVIPLDRTNLWQYYFPLDFRIDLHIHRELYSEISHQCVGSVLEHQCGGGKLLEYLGDNRSVGAYTGIDSLPAAVDFASHVTRRLSSDRLAPSFARMDLTSEKLPRLAFDTVVSTLALHFPTAGEPILRRLLDMLKPGGRLVIAALSDQAVGGLGTVQNYFLARQGEGAVRSAYVSPQDLQNYQALNHCMQNLTEVALLNLISQRALERAVARRGCTVVRTVRDLRDSTWGPMLAYVVAIKTPESVLPRDDLLRIQPEEQAAEAARESLRKSVMLRGQLKSDGRTGEPDLTAEALERVFRSHSVLGATAGPTVPVAPDARAEPVAGSSVDAAESVAAAAGSAAAGAPQTPGTGATAALPTIALSGDGAVPPAVSARSGDSCPAGNAGAAASSSSASVDLQALQRRVLELQRRLDSEAAETKRLQQLLIRIVHNVQEREAVAAARHTLV